MTMLSNRLKEVGRGLVRSAGHAAERLVIGGNNQAALDCLRNGVPEHYPVDLRTAFKTHEGGIVELLGENGKRRFFTLESMNYLAAVVGQVGFSGFTATSPEKITKARAGGPQEYRHPDPDGWYRAAGSYQSIFDSRLSSVNNLRLLRNFLAQG